MLSFNSLLIHGPQIEASVACLRGLKLRWTPAQLLTTKTLPKWESLSGLLTLKLIISVDLQKMRSNLGQP